MSQPADDGGPVGRGHRARSGAPARAVGLAVGSVSAVAATLLVFVTENARHLRLSVIAVAWAFVLAAVAAARRRADQAADQAADHADGAGREAALRPEQPSGEVLVERTVVRTRSVRPSGERAGLHSGGRAVDGEVPELTASPVPPGPARIPGPPSGRHSAGPGAAPAGPPAPEPAAGHRAAHATDAEDVPGHARLARILAENQVPPRSGRRRHRLEDDGVPADDVLSRVLGGG